MAEEQDQSQKTEEPTDQKLRKARERGQVPKSQEVNNFFMLLGIALMVGLTLSFLLQQIMDFTGAILTEAGTFCLQGDLVPMLWKTAKLLAVALIPSMLLLMALGYFGAVVQIGPLVSAESIKPTLSKISPLSGIKRMFSLKSFMEFLKSLIKMIIIGVVLTIIIMRHKDTFVALPQMSVPAFVMFNQQVFLEMVLGVLAVAALIAVMDYLYQRYEFMKEQRMTKQEIKDEMKDSFGDPHIRQRQRQIRMEQARMRMMDEIPKANVVVTNPTHYAVALLYAQGTQAAPKVVSKGTDHVALKIREKASEYGIPMVEDPPLARALYGQVDLGDEIPLTLYEAVSRVIAYVLNLKKIGKGALPYSSGMTE
ncbi:MAG: flagellar biosynthesis protein FlhB [Magnetococcales bacterium]|nr:flagellar biosynthesis protein FlhB [Magnetococcales bacterium]